MEPMEIKWNPGNLLELSGSYWKTCTLHAAVKLDIFTRIGDDHLTAADVAASIPSDTRATAMLLHALCAMGLIVKEKDYFSNTPEAKTFLSRKSDRYVGYIILHHHHLMPSWSRLDEAVQTGCPVRTRVVFQDPKVREAFLMGMFNMAMNTAPKVVPHIDIGNRRRLLDLGGGPGTWAIHFCRHHPEMTAVVFDLPATRPFAEETISRFNLSERIQFQEGSYLTDGIPRVFDVAWLSHILHGEGPEDCRAIVRKAAHALEPGGMLFIHEFILDNSRDSPLFPALFSLNMLLGTESGQAYSESELAGMMSDTGLTDIHRIPVDTPNHSGVMAARKP